MGVKAQPVVDSYLRAQVETITGGQEDLRADAADAAHQVRVATRRVRTTLRVFHRLVRRELTEPVRGELRWFAGELGPVRDAEVLRERLLTALADLPGEHRHGPVEQRLRTELDREHQAARQNLLAAMDSPRCSAMLALLDGQVPWRGRARKKAKKVLPPLVEASIVRVERTWAGALAAEQEAERDALFHRTRKKAKAARYACDALAPVFGKRATRAAAAWEEVTEALGEFQDARTATARLLQIARIAEEQGEPALTYGILIGRISEQGDQARARGHRALERATRAGSRRLVG
ncbi:CHAD domain-containing protein [Pseudactinotalea sp. Z1748]|uniref:CHAD domain-containing protein n=1 Tax=Pseudactinotalea sp. Z1748 TaxID=3413027 RepID=UPI003C7C8DE6